VSRAALDRVGCKSTVKARCQKTNSKEQTVRNDNAGQWTRQHLESRAGRWRDVDTYRLHEETVTVDSAPTPTSRTPSTDSETHRIQGRRMHVPDIDLKRGPYHSNKNWWRRSKGSKGALAEPRQPCLTSTRQASEKTVRENRLQWTGGGEGSGRQHESTAPSTIEEGAGNFPFAVRGRAEGVNVPTIPCSVRACGPPVRTNQTALGG